MENFVTCNLCNTFHFFLFYSRLLTWYRAFSLSCVLPSFQFLRVCVCFFLFGFSFSFTSQKCGKSQNNIFSLKNKQIEDEMKRKRKCAHTLCFRHTHTHAHKHSSQFVDSQPFDHNLKHFIGISSISMGAHNFSHILEWRVEMRVLEHMRRTREQTNEQFSTRYFSFHFFTSLEGQCSCRFFFFETII